MSLKVISNNEFSDMMRVASRRLGDNAKFVNSLNVFPVPDGDTGTNMNLTFQSGYKAVNESNMNTVGELAQALAKGLLMGARGNSGVITSQIFRGFSKSLEGKDTIDAKDLATAFTDGVKTSYKAVMKPVEGTILTVARVGAEYGEEAVKDSDDIIVLLKAVIEGARKALASTPDLLPVLKEVGVVDSGGQGLVFIYEGFLEGLTGETASVEYQPDTAEMEEMANATHHQSVQGHFTTEEIVNGYCTEMMINLGQNPTSKDKFDYDEFRTHIGELGDSSLVVSDDEVVKVHVHTQHPEAVFSYGHRYGDLAKIKIDNMRIQHETIVDGDTSEEENEAPVATTTKAPATDYGVVAVASGDGLKELFESLGVTYVISGGQTMNPSTNDILQAIEATNAKQVLILPNNGNIVMAAKQAVEVSEVPAAVVESKTIAQGMTSLLSFNPDASLEDNKENMTDSLSAVVSGQITNAIRDTEIDGLKIVKGHFMGIVDGKIVTEDADLEKTAMNMVDKMIDEESEIITILIGEDGNEDQANSIAQSIEDKYPDVETEIHQGDQPVYPYLIAVE
ncbi:dihydroxyacetone kinase [Companilactobacillus sp. RD055328]|uniref:DAK2 domain-containing protein n=1 Tax=Companilactobacillus sp. RD055328 TaxID=2916634 RepID=UPI001FC8D54F|nr:DAK2 domain-containing protein [Companilactobacillus sp. RD055328]GKQ42572.1 dihydroxyacetone kinase [Companilactobacillus sp. RD055328]